MRMTARVLLKCSFGFGEVLCIWFQSCNSFLSNKHNKVTNETTTGQQGNRQQRGVESSPKNHRGEKIARLSTNTTFPMIIMSVRNCAASVFENAIQPHSLKWLRVLRVMQYIYVERMSSWSAVSWLTWVTWSCSPRTHHAKHSIHNTEPELRITHRGTHKERQRDILMHTQIHWHTNCFSLWFYACVCVSLAAVLEKLDSNGRSLISQMERVSRLWNEGVCICAWCVVRL